MTVMAATVGATRGHSTAPVTRLAQVGDTATLGPMTIRVKRATSTVTPHTYVLTMSIRNRGARSVPLPSVLLVCKAPLPPTGFGVTGLLVDDRDLRPHEARSGDLTIYPQQVCENPRVEFSRHLVRSAKDRVTLSLQGLI